MLKQHLEEMEKEFDEKFLWKLTLYENGIKNPSPLSYGGTTRESLLIFIHNFHRTQTIALIEKIAGGAENDCECGGRGKNHGCTLSSFASHLRNEVEEMRNNKV